MKKQYIIGGFAAVAMALAVTSCSNDYLDLEPVSNENSESIPDNVSKMRAAAYGTMESMYRQYSTLYDYMWFNGEPWYSIWFGESMGQDENNYFVAGNTGYGFTNWDHMSSYGTWGAYIAWVYPYGIVGQANYMIAGEERLEKEGELKEETAFRMAQAHTMRAHAYIRLHQMFGPRWVDSANGEVSSVILRSAAPDANQPSDMAVSSTNEVLKFIYDDLDRAIELYEISEFGRTYNWETDITVAYGLYARAALLKNDWVTAEKYAHLAAEEYEVMTASDYKSGFNSPNSEWMWSSQESATGLYYASFGASFACNGAYPCIWGNYGAGAVDYTLYKKMQNSNDVRCELFYTPDKEGRALRAKFWNSDDCSSSTMNLNRGENFPARLQEFCKNIYSQIGEGKRWVFPYCGDYFENALEIYETYIPFGAQFKFWGTDNYAAGAFPFMRASEMLLIEAEAACHNGNYTVAQDNLEKINKNRISGYVKTSKTGDDLLEEVKLNRRWELWGEGFSWFDFKRWNEPIVRDAWEEDNLNSGNWPDSYAKKFEVTDFNNWVWPIPRLEVDYNKLVAGSTHESVEPE
ncbi:MAG: RagB/SusD family nutrient uptake outer membrane protein [Bacteroides sp.]|nr:RagB/SusD family nutrient uptake outer membrane protein [Bacteroides sp.]